jgi:phosphatidylserine decarboxylase
MHGVLRFLPKKHLSHFVGVLAHTPLPRPLASAVIRRFAGAYGINLDEVAHPVEHYRSLGEFFTRDLRPGARPIEGAFVSPVDAKLRDRGTIRDGRLPQVKGKTYALRELLGNDDIAPTFEGGHFFNFYLSPRDYHHIHAPVRGQVARSVHIPGRLWPVNDWSLASIDDLFAVNERVVTYLKSRYGVVAVVMIGATNVGKMTVTYDSFVTNVPPRAREIRRRDYPSPVTLAAGDRLGTFHMGSSVVVLVRRGILRDEELLVSAPSDVRMGQRLVSTSEA